MFDVRPSVCTGIGNQAFVVDIATAGLCFIQEAFAADLGVGYTPIPGPLYEAAGLYRRYRVPLHPTPNPGVSAFTREDTPP